MAIRVIGLDIAKSVFQVHGVDEAGQAVLRRRLRRAEVLKLFAGIEPALVGIEACHTAHYWAREIRRSDMTFGSCHPNSLSHTSRAKRTTRRMQKRFARQCCGQRCDLCRSKVLNSKRCCSCTVPAIY
jgi:transposase